MPLLKRWLPVILIGAGASVSQARKEPALAKPGTALVSISQTLAKLKDESAFYAALQASGWEVLLDGPGSFPYTVFAPTNEAFEKLKSRGYASLVDAANKSKLRAVMSFHAVSGRFPLAAFTDGQVLQTSHEMRLTVTKRGGNMWVTGGIGAPVYVHSTDILCDNGIIHVIDDVLLPIALRRVPASQP